MVPACLAELLAELALMQSYCTYFSLWWNKVAQRLLEAGADVTLCNCRQQTALHLSPPELRGKLLGWMSRPRLPPQAQLLQASWQGDLHSLQRLLVKLPLTHKTTPTQVLEDFPRGQNTTGYSVCYGWIVW